MTSKYLIPLLTSIITGCFISPSWGQEITVSDIAFTCENNNGTPITVARNQAGRTQTIFHWQEEALKTQKLTPLELCNSVTKKLNEYVEQEPNLSSLILKSYEVSGLGAVCVSSENYDCKKMLFILVPIEEKPSILLAYDTLAIIIDPDIPYKDLAPSDAVVPGYQVDFFKLK